MTRAHLYPEVSARYGAPMGRRDERPDDCERLYLQRVPMVDYDYDPGGAYWGGPCPAGRMYLAWSHAGARLWRRGRSRAEVIAAIHAEFPDAELRI